MGHGNRIKNQKALGIASLITAIIMLVEFWGGIVTNSLALLSDSGHMLSDVSSLLFSLLAMWIGSKRPTDHKTFGFQRLEILAALFNGIALFVIAGVIIWEAYGRLVVPEQVNSESMMVIAVIGMIANVISAWVLLQQGDIKDNINMRSAYLHIVGDALGSIGAIVAGIVMYYWHWYIADPIISILVAVVILKGAWGVIKQAIHILMEGTPKTIDVPGVKAKLTCIEGVLDVHELRVWSLTSGVNSLCCHLLIGDQGDSHEILRKAVSLVKDSYPIQYTTIQVEKVHQ